MAHAYVRTEVRRRQIAEAALEVIAERGLDRFTSKALAEHVGVTDGNIFRHFGTKSDIVLAAMDLLEEQMFSDPPSAEDPWVRLEAFFRHRAEFVAGQGVFGRLVFSDPLIHAAGEQARKKIVGWRRRNFKLMTAALNELQARGSLRADVTAEQLLPVLQGLVLTFCFERTVDGPCSTKALEARISARWATFKDLAAA